MTWAARASTRRCTGSATRSCASPSTRIKWQALRRDPGLARAAFEEVLRFESPVQTFFRTTTRAVEVDGVVIPEGSKVLLFLGAANRDPRHWEHADRFDITRRAGGHVGFGAGIHACVGRMLARLEGEIVLTALAERVAALTIDGPVERFLNNTLRDSNIALLNNVQVVAVNLGTGQIFLLNPA